MQKPGLWTSQGLIPLQSVDAKAIIRGVICDLTLIQTFENTGAQELEAIYTFPLPPNAALYEMTVQMGDKSIKAHVKEKEQVFEAYDDALLEGNQTFRLEHEHSNLLTLSLGKLRPQETVTVTLQMTSFVQDNCGFHEWLLPTTVDTRSTFHTSQELGQPLEERIHPPQQEQPPYRLNLKVQLDKSAVFSSIQSPSHPIQVEEQDTFWHAHIASDILMDRHVVLRWKTQDVEPIQAILTQDLDGSPLAMVTFSPEEAETQRQAREVWILLDCSDAMQGQAMQDMQACFVASLEHLSPDDMLQVVCFGTRPYKCWDQPQPATPENKALALEAPINFEDGTGSTDLYQTLEQALTAPTHNTQERQILLLSTGATASEDKLMSLCMKQKAKARIFAIGVGSTCNYELLQNLTAVTQGTLAYLSLNEQAQPVVSRVMQQLFSPPLHYVVEVQGSEFTRLPQNILPVSPTPRSTFMVKLESHKATSIDITSEHGTTWSSVLPEIDPHQNDVLRLWGLFQCKEAQLQYQYRPKAKRKALRNVKLQDLGIRYNLLTPQTSLLVIESLPPEEKTTYPEQQVRVPTTRSARRSVANPERRRARRSSTRGTTQPNLGRRAGSFLRRSRREPIVPRDGEPLAQQMPQTPQHHKPGGKLGKHLAAQGIVDETELARFLSDQYDVPAVQLSEFEIEDDVIAMVPHDVADRHKAIPLSKVGNTLIVSMVEPDNIYAIDDLKFITGMNIDVVVTSSSSHDEAKTKYYADSQSANVDYDEVLSELSEQELILAELDAYDSLEEQAEDLEGSDIFDQEYFPDKQQRQEIPDTEPTVPTSEEEKKEAQAFVAKLEDELGLKKSKLELPNTPVLTRRYIPPSESPTFGGLGGSPSAPPTEPSLEQPMAPAPPPPMPPPGYGPKTTSLEPQPQEEPPVEMREISVLRRKGVVRHYEQMNPEKMFPLLVSIVQAELNLLVPNLKHVQQTTSDNVLEIKASSPLIRIVPVLPGCLVSPPEMTVNVTQEKVDATFWVTPLVEGDLKRSAVIQLWHEGECRESISIPTNVCKQTLTKVAAACSVGVSGLKIYLDMTQWAHASGSSTAKAPAIDSFQQWLSHQMLHMMEWLFGVVASGGFWIAAGLLVITYLCYRWLRPRQGDPVEVFLHTDLQK